jgi:hypothetical protein
MISLIAVSVIAVHATWCMMYYRVSDGVIGKLLYAATALAALGYLSYPDAQSQDSLNASLALIAIRHFWMKTYWRRMLVWLPTRSRAHVSPAKPQSRRR